ncbi:MAG: uroporphyrinogen-III C-methyltransferase [Deltaproteobacteria bacterium]|nr:uroporphyrinogen-III C-methyltransferase [Deltaproteobacteria bacterium]
MTGKVFLVGAGPGDPGLITLKGARLLQQAEVVIYDFLASPELLRHVSKAAEIIYVGKKGGDHTLPQNEINQLIIDKALLGKRVVRLKGGDPFIFGRGGEEAEELAKAGIPFEIVPGVTSAIAVPAYAGIPLTHRRYNTGVAFFTGHEDPTKEALVPGLEKQTGKAETLVYLMGVKNLPSIVEGLLQEGLESQTPAALIRWGTTSNQKTIAGTLETIVQKAEEAALTPPAIFVVGKVIELRDTLNWFERRPLFGRTIVVTRTRDQASELVNRLNDLGADCLEFPTIRIVPPSDWSPLDQALRRIEDYHWIFFTSPNGVRFFLDRMEYLHLDLRSLKGIKIGVIGPATAQALSEYHLQADLIPEKFQAEYLLEALSHTPLANQKVLIPRAEQAREILPEGLRQMGAEVLVVSAYQTLPSEEGKEELEKKLAQGLIDCLTFTSSSTVINFLTLFPRQEILSLLKKVTIACIGPITAQTARNNGLQVPIVAEEYTIPGLVTAIEKYYDPEKFKVQSSK